MDDDCDDQVDEEGAACMLSCEQPAGGCDGPKEVVAGTHHACVGTEQGHIYCWGSNRDGQLATPELSHSATPVRIAGIQGYEKLLPGGSCAVRDADVVCWGHGAAHPISNPRPADATELVTTSSRLCWLSAGTVSCRSLPFAASNEPVTVLTDIQPGISAGPARICGIHYDGLVRCHDGTQVTTINEPGISMVSVGADGSVCVKATRGLVCDNVLIAGNQAADKVFASELAACAAAADGRIACWRGSVPQLSGARSLALSAEFGCIVSAEKKVQCWGRRHHGQLGDGLVNGVVSNQLVTVRPGLTPPLSSAQLLNQGAGACDNAADLERLASTRGFHAHVKSCQSTCANRLETATCFAECSKTDLSPACATCVITFATCTAEDCYEQLRRCAGVAPEFLSAYQGPPDLGCQAGRCSRTGKGHGARCERDNECLTGNCQVHPFSSAGATQTLCMARDGAYCDSDTSSHCYCWGSQAYCGSCNDGGRVASASSDYGHGPGLCYRECTASTGLCDGACKIFSNSSDRYCED